jgi:hypothetical protein
MLSAGRSALAVRIAAGVYAVVLLCCTLRRIVRVADLVTLLGQFTRNVVGAHVQDSLTVWGKRGSLLFLFVFRAPDAQEATRKN